MENYKTEAALTKADGYGQNPKYIRVPSPHPRVRIDNWLGMDLVQPKPVFSPVLTRIGGSCLP